jgi:SHAQKYF class myb-like DNA-binding protein
MSDNTGTTTTKVEDEIVATAAATAAAAAIEATIASSTSTEIKPTPTQQQQMAAATTAAIGISMTATNDDTNNTNEERVVASGRESTGRWTKQEHEKFLQGIDKYGKEWKKVAAFVKTRTVMQTRTHAQKFYEKLNQVAIKATGLPLPSKSTSATKTKHDLSSPTSGTTTPSTVNQYATTTTSNTMKKLPSSTSTATAGSTYMGGTNTPSMVVPPIPIMSFTDLDILVPINDTTASRPSNKVYMDIMKMNCFIFHSLPITEQLWFARNIVHYLSSVRHHRWIGCNYYGTIPQYQLLSEPVSVVQSDFRMDPLKVAAFAFHPFWLLGNHDIHNIHHGQPFIHRTVDGTWKHVTMNQVKDILKGEGPKNLLLLPASIPSMEPPTAVTAPTVTTTATAEEEKTKDDNDEEEEAVTTIKEEDVVDEAQQDDDADAEEEVEETEPTSVAVKKTTSHKTLPMSSNTNKRTIGNDDHDKVTTTEAVVVQQPAAGSTATSRRSKRSKV